MVLIVFSWRGCSANNICTRSRIVIFRTTGGMILNCGGRGGCATRPSTWTTIPPSPLSLQIAAGTTAGAAAVAAQPVFIHHMPNVLLIQYYCVLSLFIIIFIFYYLLKISWEYFCHKKWIIFFFFCLRFSIHTISIHSHSYTSLHFYGLYFI